jgi:4-hydroxybenzoyl-CoA reductase subunit gamma
MGKRLVKLSVNGRQREDGIGDATLLVDYLRGTAALTGTKQGCDGGECGACTVLIDGEPRLACITLAASLEGARIETIESLATNGRMSRLQQAFHEKLGAQCGFCTPGMIMSAEALLRRNPSPGEAEIRAALAGNLCRCTGYVKIVESVRCACAGTRVEA